MPPVATTVACPLLLPKQFWSVLLTKARATVALGVEIVTCAVVLQPLSSVTVTVNVPEPTPLIVALFCTGTVFQEYEYGAVPPVAFAVALPSVAPKQLTFCWAAMDALSAIAGCMMIAVAVAVQPLSSVIVQVHVPAARPDAVAVFCNGVVFQL